MSTPTVETKIYQAIKARVASLPMASTYPIKWSDGPAYTPNPSQPYLRCTWIENETQRLFIGSDDPHLYPGILQIDTMGRVAQGSGVAREVAGQVAAHFPADLMMDFEGVRARVTKTSRPRLIGIDTHIHYALSVLIEAFA